MSIKIHYSFIVYILVLFFIELLQYYLIFLISMCIHEMTHGIVGRCCGIKTREISLLFCGLSLKFNEFNISLKKKIIILISGPIINLLLSIIIYCLYMDKYIFFVICNMFLFIFNILPIYPLDGGKILYELIKNNRNCEMLFDITQKSFCIILAIICIYMYINYETIQVVFMGIYLLGFANVKKYDKYFLNFD